MLHIIFGELIPKSLGIRYPMGVIRWTGRPLQLFFRATSPIIYFLSGISNWVLRLMRLSSTDEFTKALSQEELRLLVNASFAGNEDAHTKRELIDRVLRSTDRPVRSIMVPRVDMQILSTDFAFADCLKIIQQHGYSRYPLTEGSNPDQVIGYVYIKDLLIDPKENLHILSLRRDTFFVPGSTTVGELLNEFRKTKIPLAIVVDEYGGTAGLVTVEDAAEAIVGEIQDEHDVESPRLSRADDGSVVLDGGYVLGDLDLDGIIPEEHERGETIGAYVVNNLGRLARPGDEVPLGPYIVKVEGVRRRRVHRVKLYAPEKE